MEIPQNQNRGISMEFPWKFHGNSTVLSLWNFLWNFHGNWRTQPDIQLFQRIFVCFDCLNILLLILKCNNVCYNSIIITNLPKIYSIIDNKIKSANTFKFMTNENVKY